MELPIAINIKSEEDTINLANEFSSFLNGGEVIALNGQLGAGKTFFIKHVLANYGIHNVNSPTFAIVNHYKGKFAVNHFDLYRINSINELYDIGFEDYLEMNNAITFIEWADLIPEILPEKRINILINVNEDFSRIMEIKENNLITRQS